MCLIWYHYCKKGDACGNENRVTTGVLNGHRVIVDRKSNCSKFATFCGNPLAPLANSPQWACKWTVDQPTKLTWIYTPESPEYSSGIVHIEHCKAHGGPIGAPLAATTTVVIPTVRHPPIEKSAVPSYKDKVDKLIEDTIADNERDARGEGDHDRSDRGRDTTRGQDPSSSRDSTVTPSSYAARNQVRDNAAAQAMFGGTPQSNTATTPSLMGRMFSGTSSGAGGSRGGNPTAAPPAGQSTASSSSTGGRNRGGATK